MHPRVLRFALWLGFRQAARRARRSAAIFAGVTGGIFLALLQLGIRDAIYESAVRVHRVLDGEVVIAPREFNSLQNLVWFERSALSELEAHRDVEKVTFLNWFAPMVRGLKGEKAQPLLMIGIDPEASAIDPSSIGADFTLLRIPGRALWDTGSQQYWGDVSGMLAEQGIVEMETASAALPLQFPLTVSGTFRLGSGVILLATIMVSLETYTGISGQSEERPNLGVVRLRPGVDAQSAATKFQHLLPPNIVALTRDGFIDREKTFWRTQTPIGYLFNLGALTGIFVCALFVGQALIQIVDENLNEFAVLRTLDVPEAFFTVNIVATGLLLVVLAYPFAAFASFAIYTAAAAATGLQIEMTSLRFFGLLVLASFSGVVAGLLAARRLHRADPASLL